MLEGKVKRKLPQGMCIGSLRPRRQKGAAGIEAVFLLPIILLLLFAVIHYSMIFFTISLFNYAAKEGIRNSLSVVNAGYEGCYFYSQGCADDEIALNNYRDAIRDNVASVIQNYTGSNEGLGRLFGVDLGTKDSLIKVDKLEGGGCCQVIVSLDDYKSKPFLPVEIIDGLLPGDGSVFPESLTASASMKLN